jgi:ribonuclease D
MRMPGGTRRKPRTRFDHRARSHADAHAGGGELLPQHIASHPLVPAAAPQLVTRPDELAELIAHLRAEGSFAYDSEFIGELSYHPRLCLIQVATRSRIGLLDTLAELDLRPFWELMADGAVLKIVHASEQDVEPVFRLIGKPAANLFDTQIAAGFAGMTYPCGLSKLVKEVMDVQLPKGFTFTHWDQRPLTPVQLRYAADDVRYLPALHGTIGKRLDELGHRAWAMEESAAMCDPARHALNPERDYLRIRGAAALPARQASVLRALYQWREDAAMRTDVPPRTYLKDEILLDLARKPIRNLADLESIRGLPRPVEDAEGPTILGLTQTAVRLPEEHLPPTSSGDETAGERFSADALWALTQAWCYGQGVDPALFASRQELGRWLRQMRQNGPDGLDGKAALLQGWRGELAGKGLLEFLAGRAEVRLECRNGMIASELNRR